MTSWSFRTLREIVDIYDGPHATPKKTLSGPHFLGISNLIDGRLDFSESEYLSEDDFEQWTRRVTPSPGDLVFSYETRLGQAALIPSGFRGCLGRRMGLLRVREDSVNKRFLLYAYLGPRFQEILRARTIHGSTVDRIPLLEMREFPILLPDRATQDAIASILGALDEKIELSHKMSATLEATARALFKSWFVDFNPVRAKAKGRDTGLALEIAALFPDSFEESERGEFPTGWRAGPLGEVALNERRGILHTDIIEGTPYIGLEHMPRRSIALQHWGYASQLESNKSQFVKGEFLFGKLRPYFHKVGVAPIAGVCSTDILVVSASSMDWSSFVLMHLSSDALVAHTDQCSTGTKMPRASWDHISGYEVPFPPAPVAQVFNAVITPMTERILAAIHESRTLAAIRDALLPKLISGELRLNDAERILEQSA